MENIEPNMKSQIEETVRDLLERAGFEAEVRIVEGGLESSSFPVVSIESDKDLRMLIGKNGQNLSAFEHIARLVILHKNSGQAPKEINFVVDVNNYRRSRVRYILDLAKNAASRVISTQKAEALSPMSSYERRLIHTELASYKELQTESIGEEPRRRIVIKPLILS